MRPGHFAETAYAFAPCEHGIGATPAADNSQPVLQHPSLRQAVELH